MNTMLKRIVSMFLCFVLVAGYLPAGALAAETEETVVTAAAEATNAPSVVELSDEATVVVEEEAAEAEENEEESLTADTGDPEEAVSEEAITSEEAPAEEETSDEVTSDEETSEEEITEEETSEEATEEAAAFVLEAAPVDVSLLDAEAPEHVDAAIFFSDLHTNKSDYKESTVTGIMNGLKSSNLKFSSVTSCGDAFSVNEDSGKYTGDPSKITGYIRSVFAGIPVHYVWSDHDRYAGLDNDSGFIYGAGADGTYGTADDGNYYIYELSMADLSTNNRYNADFHSNEEVTATIAAFVADAVKLKKDRPLFIASHQPLLDRRNDNGHALEWATAINEVAEDMDVAFFFGHNHKYDESGDYYYAKGSTMSVCKDKNGNAEKVKLNFTHLCTGYMEPTSTGSYSSTGTRRGVAVAVTIFEDKIQYVTYNADGKYTGSYALNETVTRDHANSGETTEVKTDEATGITVAAPGIVGLTASALTAETGLTAAQAAVSSVISGNVVAYDIRVEGFVNNSGTKASVTIPIPSDMAADKFVVYHVKNGEIEKMPGEASGQTYTFETDHFSVYVGGEKVSDNTQVDGTYTGTGNLSGSAVYSLATSIDTQKEYLIASGNKNDVQVLTNNNGTVGTTAATVSNSKITIGNDANVAWTFSNISNGTIKNNQHFVVLNDNNILNTRSQDLSIVKQASDAYQISQKAGKTTYYLRYNDGWSRSSKTAMDLYLFEKTSTNPGTSVTFTLEAPAALTTNDTTYDLTYKIELGQGTVSSQEITWTSENNAVVTVANGVLTVKGEGTTNIKAKLTRVNGTGLVEAIELTVPVTVSVKQITSIAVPSPITVFVGTSASTKVADITVTYDDGSTTKVPLTLGMLQGSYNTDKVGTYEGLTVGYGEKTATVTLVVKEKVVNNYPEYPDEGAVKVSKTGTGIDFQSSGIAQVEVSASGVPMKKGADVIVMLDTSSSMTKNNVTGTNKTRAKVLEESLANLIAYFQTPGEDGEPMDLRVAIADFNGYYGHNSNGTSNTPYDRTKGDYVRSGNSEGSGYQQPSEAQVYTGSKALDKGAFINAAELSNSYTLNYTSGTNYDYAFDAIFQLGTAIKTEDRDLYVIFMSDGASLQWNYFGTQNGYTKWNNWLAGTWTADDLKTTNLNSTAHSYFYDLNDHDGDGHINEHRMANAIKGDPTVDYEIIRKSTAGLPEGTLTKVEGKDYLYTVKGLGATMFTINFDAKQDGQITVDSIDKALASTASDQTGTTKYYYKVTTAAELENAFDAIGSEIAYAAYNARFVDQMGSNYDLKMGELKDLHKEALEDANGEEIENKIEIISYDIYTMADAKAGKIPAGSNIGDRKGTYTVLETVTFNADGTEAYSDQIGEGVNILADGTKEGFVKGVIYANTFLYNTNHNAVAVSGVNIPTGKDSANLTTGSTNELPAETFYWKMGTVQSKELAMRYYVYLEGSMEGTREGGSYPTNEFATLYYDNYVHKPCYKDTVSPVLAWKEANVSYAFYLVNENGEIIVNQNSGLTGSFANKIAVTNPVVYKTVLLNSGTDVEAKVLADDDDVLPQYYTLYDEQAAYQINIDSDGAGSWTITKGGAVNASTYVTQYKPDNAAAYTTQLTNSNEGDDYTHTVVWFAVVWSVGAYPDSVVIDYGLPVDISVLSNDMFGDYGSLAGVGDYNTEGLTETGHTTGNVLNSQNYTGTFGTATANAATGKIRYELNKSNGMQMNTYEKFGYAVNYLGSNPGYYYSSVTVIPATTIYYEDSFLDFASYHTVDEDKDSVADTYVENGMTMVKYEKDTTSAWTLEGNGVSGATQSEDRPGKYALQDANNIYGYDGVNKGMSMHSLNQARKVYVSENSYATASFQFAGTGFDVISMTSNTTGAIAVQVKAAENIVVNNTQKYAKGAVVKSFFVNTYYGYTQNANGEWEATPNVDQAIYQVPVLQVENLDYGKYDVTITATYSEYLDKTNTENGKKGYDLYLDAVRIYDPANDGAQDNDTVIEDAYKADGEGWPSYIELRNKLIAADTILGNYGTGDEKITGVVFIDGDGTVGNDQIKDYISYGPNNEVYLAPNQKVAFMLTNVENNTNIAGIHIGIKSADGKACSYTVANYAKKDIVGGVSAGTMYHEKISTVDTTTDMYYDLTDWRNDIIVISNTGSEGILSLTNIKATYKNNPNGTVATGDGNENDGIMVASELDETSGNEVDVYMTPRAAMLTLRSMNAPAEEEIPEPSVPETSEPEETLPEETKPGKPGKDEKPGKPGKDEKPGKPGKDEKPGKPSKPGKDEKPSKPGKDEKTGKAKKG